MAESIWRRMFRKPQTVPAPRVLALTASALDRETYHYLAMKGQWNVQYIQSVQEAIGLLEAAKIPIVLFDRDLPDTDWRAVLTWMARKSPATCFLLTSRVCDDYLWREVVRCGGYDVVPKPLNEITVEQTLQKAWSYWTANQT